MKTGPVIAGNWKMNLDPLETRDYFRRFAPRLPKEGGPTLIIFPPLVSLAAAVAARPEAPPVLLGVQNIHWEASGAFTGEISAPMARVAGATHTLVGHSERRHVFGETDEAVARKVFAALKWGLVPVVCVGETLSERKANRVEEVILGQLDAVLPTVAERPDATFLLAYEPVWAIGTGETATPADAAEAHGILRDRMRQRMGSGKAEEVPILYGGSVKAENAADLLDASNVDGVLVGGASLDPGSFSAIAEVAVTRARSRTFPNK